MPVFAIVPVSDLTNTYAAGADGNRFDSREEAEAAIPGLAASFDAEDCGHNDDFWTVVEV